MKKESIIYIAFGLRKLIAILAENVNLDKDNVEIISIGDNKYKVLVNMDEKTRKIILS